MLRTRFAPSPTGYLHIGGARTALFCWVYARKHSGRFVLRIEDTDLERSTTESTQAILESMKWLGLDWDEGPEKDGPHGPYYQSEKLPRYQQAVKQLLDKGLAYWDYATPDDMKGEREAAEKERRPYLYSRRWMAETDVDRKRFESEGRTGSVRLKMPRSGACELTDEVRGQVRVDWAGEQDIVMRARAELAAYIVDLVRQTRVHESLLVGAGPRATQALVLASRAHAALDRRDFVTPDDVKALAAPALVHRLIVRPEFEIEGMTPAEAVEKVIESVAVPV